MTLRNSQIAVLVGVLCGWLSGPASAYYNNDRWFETATDGRVGIIGSGVTLTWGVADDGTNVPNVLPGVDRSSDLIASLDGWFGDGGGGADLTARPWFEYLERSFNRWGEVSGVTFVYEPADDGAEHGTNNGVLGTRADIRLAGGRYDGTVGSNLGTVGYSIAPDNADIFLDTDDVGYFGNTANDAFSLRHTLMHEIGHSLGLGHVTSTNSSILMEPFLQTHFDGPQVDDVRGVQFLYGDRFESAGGNGSVATATPLGDFAPGSGVTLGADGATAGLLAFEAADFVSVSRSNDIDVYSLGVTAASSIEVTLTPVGPVFNQNINNNGYTVIDASEAGNLVLEVRQAGQSLGVIDQGPAGSAESFTFEASAGEDLTLHVSGSNFTSQLYQLDVVVEAAPLAGDYNGDGSVDAADYTVWRDAFGGTVDLAADGDQSGEIDAGDYDVWSAAYGSGSASRAVPEPCGCGLAAVSLLGAVWARSGRGKAFGKSLKESPWRA